MCGIAGQYAYDSRGAAVDAAQLAAMSGALAHRGPDGDGHWVSPDGRMGLAHRRLAIIDPSALADQPMADPSGRYQLVFNGEIYNHAELRAELRLAGRAQWRTDHSDTEVVVQAFAHWGIDCLPRLRGMFAFALWDGGRRELWLARDRLGIKPLYFSRYDGRFAFASEIKALLTDRRLPRAVDETALFHYLSFLVPPAPQTLFAGVRKLACGSWLRIGAQGEVTERRWWDVLDHVETARGESEATARDRVLAALEDSVRAHKIADVPMGVFLSGGVDSSVNAVLFSRGERVPVRTFSIGYAGDNPSYPDELRYARIVARQIGAAHHERELTPADLDSFLPEMVRLQDEPIADPVCVPVYYVSDLARRNGVKVCHVGEGADELFGGYPGWRTLASLERAGQWPLAGPAKQLGAALMAPFWRDDFRYEWLRRSAAGMPLFWGGAEAFTEGHKRALLSPRLRAQFAERSSWEVIEPFWNRFRASRLEPHPLNWMAYLDLNLRLPELLLMRVDKMSMGVGLEARVPYLDHRFVETAMSIAPGLRIKGKELKYILRQAVRGLVPDELLDRPKQGFGIPLQEWMQGALKGRVRDAVSRFCRTTDLLDPAAVGETLDRGNPSQAWSLYNLALWWEQHVAA